MGAMMPITGAIFDKYGAKRLAITGMFILTAATLPLPFNKRHTDFAYRHSLCDSYVWDFHGYDASYYFWYECFCQET